MNRLETEKSPYLLKHASNPVNWYPWGDAAFAMAAKEDKPIFLSIGYSTCHWCNVMEDESFEDHEVAALMNEHFISIKVDREERPDIDNLYMTVCQMLTGSGGWPLTVIMTPEKKPFFAGTYFPKLGRFGHTGMMELIPRIMHLWQDQREEVHHSAKHIMDSVRNGLPDNGAERPDKQGDIIALTENLYKELTASFDEQNGGFNSAPKFPSPHLITFLLRHWHRTGHEHALHMAEHTLMSMSKGGIFDHLGLGFHRYSTDAQWKLPHFEKMLYDQALLLLTFSEAFEATGNHVHADTARDICTFVLRDLLSPEGGFYCALSADSEGREGAFYLWEQQQIQKALPPEQAELLINHFNIKAEGNFIDPMKGVIDPKGTGENVLYESEDIETHDPEDLKEATNTLFEARQVREHPALDDKILTDWNGLMIAALAKASVVLGEPLYKEAAIRGADFVLSRLRSSDGKLLHRYRDGEAAIRAHADDYAFITRGLIELYEATFDPRYISEAVSLTEEFIQSYWDYEHGGFFFTRAEDRELPVRKKEFYDGAIPSANSMSISNLLRLSWLTGHAAYEHKASLISNLFHNYISEAPSG
ncbi:thioredoxin domain-containing protein [Nitrospirota bacterium]